MEPDWILIFSSVQPHIIEMLKGKLKSAGIDCVEINKVDSSYLNFGEIELYVERDCAIKATQIIQQLELE